MSIKNNFKHTKAAAYIGYITQATVNNFAPLLFLTFQKTFDIPLYKITFLITVNFLIQLCVDMISTKFVDRIGYRAAVIIAHFSAAIGLAGLGVFPYLFDDAYIGIMISVFFYAIGGGLTEVVISPIIEACPSENKSGAMSLLHSFYCWGQALVVLGSTLFFVFVGIENWRILAFIWALIPLFNGFYFTVVPIRSLSDNGRSLKISEIFKKRIFWLFILLMLCSGASELAISQWSSAFAEAGLNVNKTLGDLAGPCAFALLMGLARIFYALFCDRIDLGKFIFGSSVLCAIGYALASLADSPVIALIGCGLCGISVGIMWPGTLSLASASIPDGGTSMFALLALAGDTGCSTGPTLVGLVSDGCGGDLSSGLLAALVFPALLAVGMFCVIIRKKEIKK